MLQPHVDRHAILAMEKQFRLYDVVEERSWSVDLDAGTIAFAREKRRLRRSEPPIEMGVALLGTQADGTWMWGWANPGGFPEPVVAAGRAVSDYGREHGLAPLYEPETAISEDVYVDRIGIIASGAVPLKATYMAPADETQILFGLDHPELELGPPDIPRLVTVISALLQGGIVRDWPAAFEAYEAERGVVLEDSIEYELDDLGRITHLSARAG
jgi:hypothetical protein